MAIIAAYLLSTDTVSELEEYCKKNSHQLISVESDNLIESLKGEIPDIYIIEIQEMSYDLKKAIEKLKKEPSLKKMTIIAYPHLMDVSTEILLRKLKISTFIIRGKEEEKGREDLIKGLDKHFEQRKIEIARVGEKEKKFEKKVVSEMDKRENGEIDVNRLASQFDSMVSNEVGDKDFDTHYNLGQSYMEMGLYDNAIKSFSLSAKSTEMHLASCHMIGVCYYRQGKRDKAISTLFTSFKSSKDKKEGAGIGYELGNILSEINRKKDALNIFKMVKKIDPDFMDIREKVEKLKKDLAP